MCLKVLSGIHFLGFHVVPLGGLRQVVGRRPSDVALCS